MEEKPPRKKPGRKPGEHRQYPYQHGARFTEAGWRRLRVMASRLQTSEAEVIRQAIDEKAERMDVE